MPWTNEQQLAIENRNSSILVSAAAGSGKTTILVERILSKLLEQNNPVDIDQFLVVTFSKAAASQMREKISEKIIEELDKNPNNEHLIKQSVLVNRADIATIDSFCLNVVKENFSLLDIDSTVNIGDAGMMSLFQADVLEEIFDEHYKQKDKISSGVDFYTLVDIFSGDKTDQGLKNMILKIYDLISSYPVPKQWLCNAKAYLEISTEEELEKLPMIKEVLNIAKSKAKEACSYAKTALEISSLPGGPDKNHDIISRDIECIMAIESCQSYGELLDKLNIKFKNTISCNGDEYDSKLYEQVKDYRKIYRDIFKKANILQVDAKSIVEEIKYMSNYLVPVIELVEEFLDRYTKLKVSKKLYDFSDISHYAYKLLCAGYDKDGRAVPTEVGKKIAERYEEIYIDEYQDSNFLQEDILTSISGYYKDNPNMFLVGDVKQSIYRFRMARPDLFIDKYNKFKSYGKEIKIELKNNFRSRDVVLNTTNYFCYQLMNRQLGGIDYNEDVALVATKEYPKPSSEIEDRISKTTDILLVDSQVDEDTFLSDDDRDLAKFELEARVVAKKIKELTNHQTGQYIYDEDIEEYRLAQYKDIVILARSIKGFGESFYKVLMEEGIPVYLEDTKGYFDAMEVKTVLSLLAVIDNGRQDIPLSAVLLSPMSPLNEDDLAMVCDYAYKSDKKKAKLYDKCIWYIEHCENELSEKLKGFMNIIVRLKELKKELTISELIWVAMNLTGYYHFVAAMPSGKKRRANLDLLLEKARAYENGYYKGLFNFLRYMEKIKINEKDFGEANALSDEDNVVRIFSMHKSKGLEFPIVFLSGLGKRFNIEDSKSFALIHSDYYLAASAVYTDERYTKDTFIKKCIKELILRDNRAEELRILYVALTRAKEKLILTATDRGISEYMSNAKIIDEDDLVLPYSIRTAPQTSFIKLILMTMMRYESLKSRLNVDEMIHIKDYSYEDVIALGTNKAIRVTLDVDALVNNAITYEKNDDYEDIKSNFTNKYAYHFNTDINSKISISDIKKLKAFDGEEFDEGADNIYDESVLEDDSVDEKASSTNTNTFGSGLSASTVGTLVHKFMELFDFASCSSNPVDDIIILKNQLLKDGVMSKEELDVIEITKIERMLKSELGKRMIEAAKKGNLKKEQQFSAGVRVADIYDDVEESPGKDLIVVQGIVDAFFYEDDEIVVMDYKTDRISLESLVERHKAQLDYYGDILEKLTEKKVKEKIIYSFYNDNEIQL